MSNQTSNQWQHLTYTQKLSLMASSVATLYLIPTEVQAAIVYNGPPSPTLPIPSLSINDTGITIPWDVDGDGNVDFNLKIRTLTSTLGILPSYKFFSLTSAGLNGRGFIQGGLDQAADIRQVPDDGRVINSIGAGINYVWGPDGVGSRRIYSFDGPPLWQPGGQYNLKGFNFSTNTNTANNTQTKSGENKIGFRFVDDIGDTHYAWATLALNTTTDLTNNLVQTSTFTITEWAYNNVADGGITVGDTGNGGGGPGPGPGPNPIPEPTSPLALLGLGAAGIYRWRKQKQD
jgi:hypothetical protein